MMRRSVGLVLLFLVCVCCFSFSYFSIVQVDYAVTSHWKQVEIQLNRRADLAYAISEAVQRFTPHKAKLFVDTEELVEKVRKAESIEQLQVADIQLYDILNRLVEAAMFYPDLTQSEEFADYKNTLVSSETQLALARFDYNKAVREYNALIGEFPRSLFAYALGYRYREMYVVDSRKRDESLNWLKERGY